LDLDRLIGRYVGLRVDFDLGASGEQQITVTDPYLGHLEVEMQALQFGRAWRGWQFRPHRLADARAERALGLVLVARSFAGDLAPPQA